jgi:hypothetical protein
MSRRHHPLTEHPIAIGFGEICMAFIIGGVGQNLPQEAPQAFARL